jgi:hypothetical protein
MTATIPMFIANLNRGSSFQVRNTIARSQTTLKSSINADQISSSMQFDFPSFKSIEAELKSALEKARDIDKRYGLCTEPSQQAWNLVDSLYAKMQNSQESSELPADKSEANTSKNAEGQSYYFF